MRWLFLLLLILNLLYGVWHQQEAPMRAKEIAPLALYKGSQQDIKLLSESVAPGKSAGALQDCLYIGGYARADQLVPVRQRLASASVEASVQQSRADQGGLFWLRVAPSGRHLLEGSLLESVSREFNDLKRKIMPCEGIASSE